MQYCNISAPHRYCYEHPPKKCGITGAGGAIAALCYFYAKSLKIKDLKFCRLNYFWYLCKVKKQISSEGSPLPV